MNTSLHFKKLEEIGGEGKNSRVFIGHDIQLNAEIVIKCITKSSFQTASNYFDEAKMLYTSNHPNIAPVQYSCQDEEHIYITMPLFKRGSLNKKIDERPLKLSEIIKYSIDFLSGLHHIHTKKLIHCDIKPTNILISNSNDAILTDFGLARYLNEKGLTTIDSFYNLHRAPETFLTDVINHQSDIFQAGLTIYRLCNGNNHFKSQLDAFRRIDGSFDSAIYIKAILSGKFPDRSSYLLHIPQRLKNYIKKALAVNPAERYNSVLDLLNDLAGIEIDHDWQFSTTLNSHTWNCFLNDKEYVVDLSPMKEGWKLKTTKRALSSEKPRNIVEYCKESIKFDDGYKIIKEALKNKSL